TGGGSDVEVGQLALVQCGDVGQAAKPLPVVEPVADHEPVGDLESHVPALDVGLPPFGLGEQRAHLERGRLPRLQIADQVGQRQPGVDDVLDDHHVATLDVGVQVLEDPNHARGVGAAAVARHRHEVDLTGHGDLPHQVGHEEDGALQHAHQQQVAAGVVA